MCRMYKEGNKMAAYDTIGDRMKEAYERRSQSFLLRKCPVILRLDGVCFHTLLKNAKRPFDMNVIRSMVESAYHIMDKIQGCKLAYLQSDEVSFLLSDWDRPNSEAWFNYNIQKMASVSASMMTNAFYMYSCNYELDLERSAFFDSRAFNVPYHEVANYFIWRQRDWNRNSLAMLCQQYFSHSDLYKKNTEQRRKMVRKVGDDWENLPDQLKNGTLITLDGKERYHRFEYTPRIEDWYE